MKSITDLYKLSFCDLVYMYHNLEKLHNILEQDHKKLCSEFKSRYSNIVSLRNENMELKIEIRELKKIVKEKKNVDNNISKVELIPKMEKELNTNKPFVNTIEINNLERTEQNLNINSIYTVNSLEVNETSDIFEKSQPNRLEITKCDSTINGKIPDNTSNNKLDNKNKVSKLKITESNKILNKVKNYYYEYYDKYLPDRNINNFENFNNNIKCIHIKHIENIIEFYELFKKYIKNNDDKYCSKSFNNYIKYNNNDFCFKYFSNLYEKVKKCYDFIKYLKEKNIKKNEIINLLFKSNLTYTKLYKIKLDDYEKLKQFFIEKIEILRIESQPENNLQPDRSKINRTTNKDVLLSYIGTKHDYINEINKHIDIKENSNIYDLFAGSCSIPYSLKKKFQNNNFIINDINKHIINFYNELKNNKQKLIKKIEELNTIENIENYQKLLNIINDNNSTNIDKASVYYILNKIAYNGKIFYDKNNRINIYSYEKSKINIDKNKFDNFSNFLKDIEINNKCLLDSTDYWLDRINKDDIVILDPPYDILNKQNNHYMNNLNRNEQIKLCIFINKLIKKNVKIIIFNGDTLFIRNLYKSLNIKIIESNTKINKNKYYKELLIYN